MKSLIILFLMLVIGFNSKGDQQTYTLKLEVTVEQELIEGYMSIESDTQLDSVLTKQMKSSDSIFTSFIIENNPHDSLYIYSDMYSIDSLSINIFFQDELVIIPEDQVDNIRMEWINEKDEKTTVCSVHSTEDLNWLKEAYRQKEIYFYGNCTYELFHFGEMEKHEFHIQGNKYLNNLDLTYDETFEWESLLQDYLEWLKGKKVMITYSCRS